MNYESAVTELLSELVRRVSITPEDAGCQDLLVERLEPLGFDCEWMPFGDVRNLWARRGSGDPVFCFAGHTDVVPPGPTEEWHTDPFEPVVKNGQMFGRGTADMKSGLAAMLVATESFLQTHNDFPGSIAFLITSDEEGRAREGTLKVVEELQVRGERIDWCVIGEPSSANTVGDVVRIGRRGSLSGMLTVKGVQGHVAYPQLADNPIARFAPVLSELVQRQWDDGNDYFPPTSFQVVELKSGVGAPNVTPGELYTRFNFRYSTVWDHERLMSETARVLDSFALDYSLDWHLSGKPFLTNPGKLTQAVTDTVRAVGGFEPELSTGGGTSDGRFISPMGADVVELGPVNASIHKVNEHVDLSDVGKLASMYELLLEKMLAR